MIREITRADRDRVLELLRQLWPEKQLEADGVSGVMERYLTSSDYWVYGYEQRGAIQGMITISFRWSLFHQGEVAIIEDLVVDEAHRGQGMGKALVSFVETYLARESRGGTVEVNSDFHREAAHSFWASCGYSRLGFQFRKEIC